MDIFQHNITIDFCHSNSSNYLQMRYTVPKSIVPIFFFCMVQFKAWFNTKWDFTFSYTCKRSVFRDIVIPSKPFSFIVFFQNCTLYIAYFHLVDSFPIQDGKCLPSRRILSSSTTCDLGLDTFIVHESFEDSISFFSQYLHKSIMRHRISYIFFIYYVSIIYACCKKNRRKFFVTTYTCLSMQ